MRWTRGVSPGARSDADPRRRARPSRRRSVTLSTLLEIQDLKTYFHTDDGVVRSVDGVSLSIEEGTTVGLVGESGCGKSVTSLSVRRLIPQPPATTEAGGI